MKLGYNNGCQEVCMSQEKRRRFDKEFKMETARLTVEKGKRLDGENQKDIQWS
jgi:hypothetical protein